MKEKHDKPSQPNYPGGEDEPADNGQKSGSHQAALPVDESDDGPAATHDSPFKDR